MGSHPHVHEMMRGPDRAPPRSQERKAPSPAPHCRLVANSQHKECLGAKSDAKLTHETGMACSLVCSFIQHASKGSLLCRALNRAPGIQRMIRQSCCPQGAQSLLGEAHRNKKLQYNERNMMLEKCTA